MKDVLHSVWSAVSGLFRPTHRMGEVDAVLGAVVISLLGFGVVMVFSSSVVEATVTFDDPHYFLKRQAIYACAAMSVLFLVSRIDYARLLPFTYPVLGLVVLLLLLSVAGLGHTGGGAARWLRLGPIHVQPSEMAKLGLILWLGYSLAKKKDQVKNFSVGLLPHVLTAGFVTLLCLKQPDFGGAAVMLLVTVMLLFVAGARIGYLMGLMLLGFCGAAWLVRFKAYRWERMLAWLHMDEHRQDLAYQPFQSVMSFGSGEWTGMGLGKGLQVLYLPEAHTDFISAIVGEELGLFGVVGLCVAYVVIVTRGVRIAMTAHDEYGTYVAFGISALFGLQAFINLSVAMAMLPTKGLTLPFVSYGGSSLLVNAAAMGVLLNISRQRLGATTVGNHASNGAEASAVLASGANFSGAEKSRAQVGERKKGARAGAFAAEEATS